MLYDLTSMARETYANRIDRPTFLSFTCTF